MTKDTPSMIIGRRSASNPVQPTFPKTFLVRTGLLKGKTVAVIHGHCTSALGNYRYVEVWQKDKTAVCNAKFVSTNRVYPAGSRRSLQRLVPKLKNVTTHRFRSCVPIHVFQSLKWWAPADGKKWSTT